MLPAKFWKSTALRLALSFATLFMISFLAAGVAAYLVMKSDLAAHLDRQVSETFSGLEGLYESGDTADVIAAVDRLAQAAVDRDRIYSILDQSGAALAGNIPAAPSSAGWVDADSTSLGIQGRGRHYRIYSADVGQFRMIVGASSEASADVLSTAVLGFAWATLGVAALAIAGGTFIAHRAQKRIHAITSTMDAIAEGRLGARIALTHSDDDLDQLGAQINAALERLERLIEGMRQVSADIAHDLKTPISRLYIDIEAALEKAALGEPDADGLREVLASAHKVNETFDALLRIAQIEAGARRSRFTQVDMSSVFETLFEAYAPVAEERGHSLSLALPSSRPPIFGDTQLLLQMMSNLVENAIGHCPPGTPIRLEMLGGGSGVRLLISDGGHGIPAAERGRVFERLYRLEKSRTTPGSGLGLSLVKAVADLHGASIELSDNGPGLVVSIRFPPPQKSSPVTL
jgi:signal transduction histidine kinase